MAATSGAPGSVYCPVRRQQRGLGPGPSVLSLPNGIPPTTPSTASSPLSKPQAFQDCFTDWLNAVWQDKGISHIAIDGKSLRGTHVVEFPPACIWSAPGKLQQRLKLDQIVVHGKSNEITAIPEVFSMLELKGALASIDVIGCQKNIAEQIRKDGGDYLLALKANQPKLHAAVVAYFRASVPEDFGGLKHGFIVTEEDNRWRQEERVYTVLHTYWAGHTGGVEGSHL